VEEKAEKPTRFRVVAGRSAVLVRARSNVGLINFGTTALSGEIVCVLHDGKLTGIEHARGTLEIRSSSFESGNALYDAEIHRRIHARRYPNITVELTDAASSGDATSYRLGGTITLGDIAQQVSDIVSIEVSGSDRLVVSGTHALDIRDFKIEAPSTLLLNIYPEVVIELHLEAVSEP
jgi:polyisoprenoid-binding protein YceI